MHFLTALALLFALFEAPCAAAEESVLDNVSNGLGELLLNAVEAFRPAFGEAGKHAVKLFAIVLITGVGHSFCGGNTAGARAAEVIGVAALLAAAWGDADAFIAETIALTREVLVILHATLPTLTTAAAMSGSSEAAVGAQAVYLMSADMAAMLIETFLLPALAAYLALAAISAALNESLLDGAAEAMKTIITFFLRLILTVFIGYTGILKIFGTVADSVTKRSLKLAVASAVPVIGSIAAEAADSVFAVAGAVKSSIGITGLLGILSTALLPVIRMCVWVLVFRLFTFLIAPAGSDGMSAFIGALAEFYGLLLAVAGSVVLLAMLAVLSGFVFITF